MPVLIGLADKFGRNRVRFQRVVQPVRPFAPLRLVIGVAVADKSFVAFFKRMGTGFHEYGLYQRVIGNWSKSSRRCGGVWLQVGVFREPYNADGFIESSP